MHVEETDPRGAEVLGSDVWALPLTEDRILKGFLFFCPAFLARTVFNCISQSLLTFC